MRVPEQKDAFTGRWRRVKASSLLPSEMQIHIDIVKYARTMAKPGVIFWHTSNGELVDKRMAAKRKALGVLPGVSDLTFIKRAPWSLDCLRVLFLEVKRLKGRQSEAQVEFERCVKAAGCYYAIARDLNSAIDVLERFGMVRPRKLAIET